MNLSVIIITKNEEDNIEQCIKSVKFADEVIVIDAESNDDTAAIAGKLGASIYVRPWPGFGPQKNFGAAQSQGEWLLFLDADEKISPVLAQEIQDTIAKPDKDFYWLKIVTIFLNQPLNHLYGFNPRLYRKSAGAWTSHHVHEQLQNNTGQIIDLKNNLAGVLNEPLHHHSHRSVAAYLTHIAETTALDAQHMAKHDQHRSGRSVKPNWSLPLYLATRQFIKLYLYKKGILDGFVGLKWSALSAYYEYVLGKKYLRLKSGRRLPHQPVLR